MVRFISGNYFQLKELINAHKSTQDLQMLKELHLHGNKAIQMPNMDTLIIYFKQIITLDISNNQITNI